MINRKIVGIAVLACAGAAIPLYTLASGMLDPTRPYGYRAAGAKSRGLVLQSTVVSEGRKVAMINGRNYVVGDRVGTSTLIEIQPYEVKLKRGGKITRLRLLPKRERVHLSE